jgi:hypothetical protein
MMLLRFAAVAFAAFLLTAAADAKNRTDKTCFDTTREMKRACSADIADDYFEQSAKCLNSDDPRGCRRDALADYQDSRGECKDQAEARDSLCERLPDQGPYIAELDPADFDGTNGVCAMPAGQNPYFPLIPGTVTKFKNETPGEEETVIVTVTDETRTILGIDTIVVNDQVFEGLPDDMGNPDPDADPIEDTDDYYAIDKDCNVWYLGEIARNFEDGYLTDLDGSFIAGENDAQAGIVMLADPQVGDVYRQEFALGDAEDAAEVLALDADNPDGVGTDVFDCAGMCLKTEDFIGNEPDALELKFYVPGIGFVVEQLPDGDVVLELVATENP